MLESLRQQLKSHAPTSQWLDRLVPLGADREARNIRFVLTDGIGVGLGLAAAPFVPVLLARLGADNFSIGLWSALPALSRLVFGIAVGRFLASRSNIIPWFSAARFIVLSSYGLIGLIVLLEPQHPIQPIIGLFALTMIPYAIVAVCVTIVMAKVAGARGRYYLLSRRWALVSLATLGGVALGSVALDNFAFPQNYAFMFIGLASGGLVSFYFSRQIELPAMNTAPAPPPALRRGLGARLHGLTSHPAFVRFAGCHFLLRFGLAGATPLIPLYYVRSLHATDGEIGWIVAISNVIPVVAYFIWSHLSRKHHVRLLLLVTAVGVTLQPLLLPLGSSMQWAIWIAAVVAIFQAGFDLAIFDALASSLPETGAPFFAGIYQTTLNLALFTGPLAMTAFSEVMGVNNGLLLTAAISAVGVGSFFLWYHGK